MRRIRSKMIWGASLMASEVSTVIYQDFLPQALTEGRYVAAPEPAVIGQGLNHIQAGLDAQKERRLRQENRHHVVTTTSPTSDPRRITMDTTVVGVLGLGGGYPQQAASTGRDFGHPLGTMRDYRHRMENQTWPPAPDVGYPLIIAANGPKMIALAGEIADGSAVALPDPYRGITGCGIPLAHPSPAAVVSLFLLRSTQPIEHLAQLLLGVDGQLFENDLHDRG